MQITDMQSFGVAVRNHRQQQGVTQAQLAAMTNTSQRFISALENGKPTLHVGKVFNVAKMLGIKFEAQASPIKNDVTRPLTEQILNFLEHAPDNAARTDEIVSYLGMNTGNKTQMLKLEQALRYLIENMQIESDHKNTTGFTFSAGTNGALINMRTFMLTPGYLYKQQLMKDYVDNSVKLFS